MATIEIMGRGSYRSMRAATWDWYLTHPLVFQGFPILYCNAPMFKLRFMPILFAATHHNFATPCNFQDIKIVIEQKLGKDLHSIFLEFDEHPIAAASIAQVHRGRLNNNQEVAVKVQYPGLERRMKIDIMTMSFLSKSVSWLIYMKTIFYPCNLLLSSIQYSERRAGNEHSSIILSTVSFFNIKIVTKILKINHSWSTSVSGKILVKKKIFPDYRFEKLLTEFERTMSMELDFTQEAKNSERTASCFRKNNVVKVPCVFWVDNLDSLRKADISPTKVAETLIELFGEMIFVHGFVHGDPHPGNILVSPQGQGKFSLVLLDHGIYKELDQKFRLDYCQLWKALILLDSQKILELGEQFGVGKYAKYFPVIFTGRTIERYYWIL
uniref:ABC1 family protein n=1 Tax=Oryza sativa subsp. japonica TaxID=39947 RepID=Q2R2S4_ORYSJ|nr:ABC1 family protein [Oryza sativa Japonica Group]